jgi:hypothetical protein
VESSAWHLPPSICSGQYTRRVMRGSVQTLLQRPKYLWVQGNEPYKNSTSLRPHGMHGVEFVWMQHLETKVPQYSTKYINFITDSSTICGTTLDHNITGIYRISLLSAHSGSPCVLATTVSRKPNGASTFTYWYMNVNVQDYRKVKLQFTPKNKAKCLQMILYVRK